MTTRSISLCGVMLGSLLLAGCGGDSHDAVMQDSIAQFKKITASLKQVKDKDSAAAQSSALKGVAAEMKAIKARGDALPKATAEQEKALRDKYEKELSQVMGEFMGEMMRVAMLGPDVQKELKSLEDGMKDMQ